MNYTVVWQPPALATLAKLWTDGPDRNAVAGASDSIDARLARDPLSQGESRDGPYRILFVSPLVVDLKSARPNEPSSCCACATPAGDRSIPSVDALCRPAL